MRFAVHECTFAPLRWISFLMNLSFVICADIAERKPRSKDGRRYRSLPRTQRARDVHATPRGRLYIENMDDLFFSYCRRFISAI